MSFVCVCKWVCAYVCVCVCVCAHQCVYYVYVRLLSHPHPPTHPPTRTHTHTHTHTPTHTHTQELELHSQSVTCFSPRNPYLRLIVTKMGMSTANPLYIITRWNLVTAEIMALCMTVRIMEIAREHGMHEVYDPAWVSVSWKPVSTYILMVVILAVYAHGTKTRTKTEARTITI